MIVRAAAASIAWVYHHAATLTDCTITCDADTKEWRASGTITEAIAFRLAQRPLTLTVSPAGGGAWRWPITELEEASAGVFRARLGSRERRR